MNNSKVIIYHLVMKVTYHFLLINLNIHLLTNGCANEGFNDFTINLLSEITDSSGSFKITDSLVDPTTVI